MAVKAKSGASWFTILLIVAAMAIWAYDHKRLLENARPSSGRASEPSPLPIPGTTSPAPIPGKPPVSSPERAGRFEIYRNCTLVPARNNDGDSFMVHLHDGREVEFRLYFVDTPESAFKTYSDGDTNHDRIREQAGDLDHITPEQAVEIGKKGKALTLELLSKEPFTLYTEWDSPFRDGRFHAHIQVRIDGKPRWLHRVLVQRGLARIKTKGADLPDGTSASREKETLRNLEREAKNHKVGVWAW